MIRKLNASLSISALSLQSRLNFWVSCLPLQPSWRWWLCSFFTSATNCLCRVPTICHNSRALRTSSKVFDTLTDLPLRLQNTSYNILRSVVMLLQQLTARTPHPGTVKTGVTFEVFWLDLSSERFETHYAGFSLDKLNYLIEIKLYCKHDVSIVFKWVKILQRNTTQDCWFVIDTTLKRPQTK